MGEYSEQLSIEKTKQLQPTEAVCPALNHNSFFCGDPTITIGNYGKSCRVSLLLLGLLQASLIVFALHPEKLLF